jgi:hypothetical protein
MSSDFGRANPRLLGSSAKVAQAEQGDLHGRVDHESLGVSLRAVADCLSQLGQRSDADG